MRAAGGRPVQELPVELVQFVNSEDAHSSPIAFGGQVVQWMDMAVRIPTKRHVRKPVVTTSIDGLSFFVSIPIGDFMIVRVQVNYIGKIFMEVGGIIKVEPPLTAKKTRTIGGCLTFVALDEVGHPTPIPSVAPHTSEEQPLDKRTHWRREEKLKHRFDTM